MSKSIKSKADLVMSFMIVEYILSSIVGVLFLFFLIWILFK